MKFGSMISHGVESSVSQKGLLHTIEMSRAAIAAP